MLYNKYIDHTLLKPDATEEQIRKLCQDALEYDFASVCVNPGYVPLCHELLKGSDVKVCTVIGFPNGYNTTAVTVFETKDAIANGADEIDMVINIGDLKDKEYDKVEDEIRQLKEACGDHILKVIIETCLLTDEEKIKMCELVTKAGADFIKTSTGFSKAGATFEDIKLFSEHIGESVRMKAAGGIKSFEDAEEFLRLGAKRLGTSRIVKLAKAEKEKLNGNKDTDTDSY